MVPIIVQTPLTQQNRLFTNKEAAMLKTLLKLLIRLYQWTLGTVLPNSCRFTPTCSHYALQALDKHGVGTGILLTVRRLLRCHPFSAGGYDPVPEKTQLKGVKK